MTTLSKRDNQLRFLTALLLISIVINVTTIIRVTNRPVKAIVVHKVDNATVLHGKITGKQMIGKLYTIDCGRKEQYDNVQVGDDITSYLKGRGN
ncbi:gp93 [Streptococcus phage Sfi11]|uniref:Gp93 n=1 Tax=Streptococcus phage Sfi11 TaxID=2681625 RepID=Q9MCH8_9CAUD|nr:gp93 [Streptococcus phage Sfi11]AAF63068.1 gp93 [Streptococcus phage Sfi11]